MGGGEAASAVGEGEALERPRGVPGGHWTGYDSCYQELFRIDRILDRKGLMLFLVDFRVHSGHEMLILF